ncbi:helix-turn-helix domain-containing protein [Pseudonocardia sp. CA-107938]|uniref:helix-turn-helix domain-containing protein n=1 Tax=Pseudonocardia sp. CA-107938 TaxID=3240021 RepID=UPI003D8DD490
MATTPPIRWLIGTELARYRTEAKLSLNEAAERAGVTRHKVNNLEAGRQIQDPDDIAVLLTAYGVPARDIDRLTTLTGRADEAMWWAPWAQVVPDWLKTYVGLEALAERMFVFEAMVIHGLLQTPDYAAAVTASAKSIRPDHGDRFVSFRMARARRLTDPDNPLELHSVIPQWALDLAVGTPEVRRAQLEHLLEMSDLPNVTIQVLRPEDGPHQALGGGFAHLDFGEAVRPVVYIELKDGAVYLQEELQVGAYRMVFTDLQQVALGPEQSREVIASMLKQ